MLQIAFIYIAYFIGFCTALVFVGNQLWIHPNDKVDKKLIYSIEYFILGIASMFVIKYLIIIMERLIK